MNRFRHRGFLRQLPPLRAAGLLALMGFALFVSFRIFTPPVKTVQILAAPDGRCEARLQQVFYYSNPGYKVALRSGRLWHTVFYLPEITNAPAGPVAGSLRWSATSDVLFFEINGRPVRSFEVPDQSSSRKSP